MARKTSKKPKKAQSKKAMGVSAKKGGKTGQSGRKKGSDPKGIDPRYVTAYAWHRSGVRISDICKKFRRGKSQIYAWIDQVKVLVEKPLEMEELRNATMGLYPLAVDSLVHNLKKKKEVTTNNFLNKTVFAGVGDDSGGSPRTITNIFQLGAGLAPLLRGIDDSTVEACIARLEARLREETQPPVVSRIKGSSDPGRPTS